MQAKQKLHNQYSSANNKLLEFIELPKRLLLSEINGKNCIHNADFNLLDQECWGCDIGPECLHLLDKFKEPKVNNNENKLKTALEISINYIEKITCNQKHKLNACTCETCTWLREARSFMSPDDKNTSNT